MFDIRRNELDEQGNRVFEIELSALRTHRKDVERVLRSKGDFELRFWATRDQHAKTGLIDPDDPCMRVVFEKGVDPDGIWHIQIDAGAADGSWERELWRQDIFVQKERRLDDERLRQLAERYAPIFIFSGEEKYFPVSLGTLLGCDAIKAGVDMVLVVGGEVQNTVNAKIGADYLARAAHYKRQREIDPFTFPCLFGKRTKHVVEETDTTMDDLALASVKAYGNANRNPFAHMSAYKGMTYENASTASDKNPVFLGHGDYRPFLRVSDCSQVSDGGSALVLCSEEGLAKIGRSLGDATEVLSCVVSTASIAEDPNPLRMANTENAVAQAYAQSGLSAADMQVAEVHDCFTVTEILMYEALGLAEAGKGAQLLRDGATAIDGKVPVNTGGGLVGFGHPVGATGVKQALEIHRQLTGQCGDYQVAGDPSVGVTANMGGDDRTSVVGVYKRAG